MFPGTCTSSKVFLLYPPPHLEKACVCPCVCVSEARKSEAEKVKPENRYYRQNVVFRKNQHYRHTTRSAAYGNRLVQTMVTLITQIYKQTRGNPCLIFFPKKEEKNKINK